MTYLFDVSALIALGVSHHIHHARVMSWLRFTRLMSEEPVRLATCAITEIGFVRIAGGGAGLISDVDKAKAELLRLKCTEEFVFLPDRVGVEHLPAWVRKPTHVTDGHLLQLARSYDARLATLDTGIPGAELILDAPQGPLAMRDSATLHRSSYEMQRWRLR